VSRAASLQLAAVAKAQAHFHPGRSSHGPRQTLGRHPQLDEIEASGRSACIGEDAGTGQLDTADAHVRAVVTCVGDGHPE